VDDLVFTCKKAELALSAAVADLSALASDGQDVVEVTHSALTDAEVFASAEGALDFYRAKFAAVQRTLGALENGVVAEEEADATAKRIADLFSSAKRNDDEEAQPQQKKKKQQKQQQQKKNGAQPQQQQQKKTGEDEPLVSFLKTIRCDQYAATFAAEDIRNVRDLRLVMQDSDLRDIGLPVGPRRRIQAALLEDRVVTPPTCATSMLFDENVLEPVPAAPKRSSRRRPQAGDPLEHGPDAPEEASLEHDDDGESQSPKGQRRHRSKSKYHKKGKVPPKVSSASAN